MDPEKVSMDRFAREWQRALGEALPALDLDHGAREVLRAQRDAKAKASVLREVRWRWLAAATLCVAVVTVLVLQLKRPAPALPFTLNQQTLAEGAHVTTSHDEQVLRFAEGSTIALGADSSLQVPEARPEKVGVVIRRGSAHFDVVKRPDATWSIQAGPFEVRVLGTAFDVHWQPEQQHFSVAVTRGTVTVNGPMLGGVRTVSAGARCVVDLHGGRFALEPNPTEASSASPPTPAPTPTSSAEVAPTNGAGEAAKPEPGDVAAPSRDATLPERPLKSGAARSNEVAATRRAETWRELERMGRFEEAVKLAERSGLDAIYDLASVEDLMSLARAARFVGRQDISAGALLSCRRRFPGGRDAAMAAYLLGRNASPVEAVRWFTAYLAEEPGGSWAREAAGRLIEAHSASGNKAAAQEAAQKYLARYPSGPHAEFAHKVLQK